MQTKSQSNRPYKTPKCQFAQFSKKKKKKKRLSSSAAAPAHCTVGVEPEPESTSACLCRSRNASASAAHKRRIKGSTPPHAWMRQPTQQSRMLFCIEMTGGAVNELAPNTQAQRKQTIEPMEWREEGEREREVNGEQGRKLRMCQF